MYLLCVVIFGTWNTQGEILMVASLYFILMHYLEIIHIFEKLTNGDILLSDEEIT